MMSPLAIIAILLVLCFVGWLFYRFQSSWWLAVGIIAVAAVVAAVATWPRHVATVHVPRIEKTAKHVNLTRHAAALDVSRFLGRAAIRITPEDGFGDTSSAELFWLEEGRVRHSAIAEKGRLLATRFSGPNEWPLRIGVVVRHPEAIHVTGRWVYADGHTEGADALYDTDNPAVQGDIEDWGRAFLEKRR